MSLPQPSPEALAHSARVVEHLRGEIVASGGWLSFARYMELALYAPGLGYYASGTAKLGAAGDFITAPELSPFFGRTLAHTVAAVLADTAGDVLELGAGSGRLAVDLLLELERLDRLPARYFILEVSPDLRERQRKLLADKAAHLLDRIVWLEFLPETLTGVVVGNEVLDALPVHLLHRVAGTWLQRGVVWQDGFAWEDRPAPPGLVPAGLPEQDGYLSEVCPAAAALVASLGERLHRGALLFIDYGYPLAEYYHPQRNMGTLMLHYRHHSLSDPFFLPGLADITAHVDFSAVAAASDLDLLGYTSQSQFLLDAGLLDLLSAMDTQSVDYLRAVAPVQKLLQPTEMGELFKVIALGRGIYTALPGFRRGDRRGAL